MDKKKINTEEEKENNGPLDVSDCVNGALEECMRERDEYLNGWKRAKADFINYKKGESERFSVIAKFSSESLISELILILDSFDLAISVLENDKAAHKGVSLIKFQLEDVLRKYGLEKIYVMPGAKFDPREQEAIGEIFSKYEKGLIAEEVESGYKLHGKILRPSKVKISTHTTAGLDGSGREDSAERESRKEGG